MHHVGIDTFIEVDNKKYKLSRFERKEHRKFLDWADKVIPDPFELIMGRLESFPPALQEILVKEALQYAKMRLTMLSPEVQNLLQTSEGGIKLLEVMLQRHHPELTTAEVENIYDRCQEEHGPDYLISKVAEVSGRLPVTETEAEREKYEELGLTPKKKRLNVEQPEDWIKIDKILAREFNLMPSEVDCLTVSEIALLLQAVPKEQTTDFSSMEEAVAFASLYHKLTPKQKYEVGLRSLP